MRYKCPICDVTAEIDVKNKKVTIFLNPQIQHFPNHACELAKAVNVIDLNKLEKLG